LTFILIIRTPLIRAERESKLNSVMFLILKMQ